MPDALTANQILERASELLGVRGQEYEQQRERSIGRVVGAFNALTEHKLTNEQGWLFMVLLKLARAQGGSYKADNFDDGAAYVALMGEQASLDHAQSIAND
jgi:Domain of unknown function (DUF6378)